MTAHGWTISEACAEFERAGLPVDPDRFRMAIRAVQLRPVGETSREIAQVNMGPTADKPYNQWADGRHRWLLDGTEVTEAEALDAMDAG